MGAVLVALWWVLLFYGLVDLLVAVVPSSFPQEFYRYAVLEASWGLLYTFLLPMPLIAWAVRPSGWVGPQVLAIAAAVLVAGVAGAAFGQAFMAFVVAASAAFPRMWQPRPRWSVRLIASPIWWPASGLVIVGLGAGLLHAWDVLQVARSGVADDNTWGLWHLPMQAGFALAVPAAAGAGVLAAANRVRGWWFSVVPAALCAVLFGLIALEYPSHLASPGEVGGIWAVCWGTALLVIVEGTGWLHRRTPTRRAG